MEKQYSKQEILNMYLNTINYGDGCYGIEAAAQNYFQKSAKDLSLVQAATLVGIPQSPTELNPKENPEACLARRNLVLDRMLTAGDITQEQHDKAVAKKLKLKPAPDEPLQGIYAYPYFTSYVRDELMKPDNIYGCTYADLFQGGLKIYTTLDVDMQKKAEEACSDQYGSMDEGMEAALVAMDPTNGYVKAIVGGNDFYTDQWNIATQGGRPSGSTFKVFTLAAAIEQGISPKAAIDCSNPVTLTNGQTINNFGSANYGMRTISDATAISSNTGYYRLTEKVGVDKLIEMAHRAGIDSDLSPYPIIVLGTENVTPLEMAEAYSTFADGGVHHDPVVITRIEDAQGNILFENADTSERVIDESVAGAVTEVLTGVFNKSYATAYGSGPSNGQPVAGKTGTGVEFRDHWLVGYSPTLTCAAWIGNRDYSSTSESLTANSLWHNFMTLALEDSEIVQFPIVPSPVYDTAMSEMLTDQSDIVYVEPQEDKKDKDKDKDKESDSSADDGTGTGGSTASADQTDNQDQGNDNADQGQSVDGATGGGAPDGAAGGTTNPDGGGGGVDG
jgi:membrane peptidoglycan carboxypeptidase